MSVTVSTSVVSPLMALSGFHDLRLSSADSCTKGNAMHDMQKADTTQVGLRQPDRSF